VAINRADLEAIKAAIIGAINSAAGTSGASTGPDPEEINKLNERLSLLEKTSKALENQEARIRNSSNATERQNELDQIAIDRANNIIEQSKIEIALEKQKATLDQAKIDRLEQQIQKQEDLLEIEEGLNEQRDESTRKTKEQEAAMDSLAASMQGLVAVYDTHSMVSTQNIISMAGQIKQAGIMKTAAGLLGGAFVGLVDTMISLAFKTDEAASRFMAFTGASEAVADGIMNDVQAMSFYGVQVDQLYAAHAALRNEMTEFSMLQPEMQREVANTGALLEKQGVAMGDYAKATQLGMKAFGLGAEGAAAASRDLNSLALQIGITPQQMAQDFVTAGDEVAAFGGAGVSAFKDLAVVSKATGLEIDKLLRISKGFDTFEGAATQAGKLNAALGGNFVNAMDLLMAKEPAKRFEMIRDAVLKTGKTFDDMSYFERKFYVNAIEGIETTSDLALLMSGDLDALKDSSKETTASIKALQDRTKAIQSIQERFTTLLMKAIPVATTLITAFEGLAAQLEGNDEAFKKFESVVKDVVGIASLLINNIDKVAYGLAGLAVIKLAASIVMWFKGLGKAAPDAADGMKQLVGPTVAFGAAIGIAGFGIGIAANGLANLAEAFSSLSAEQISGFNQAIDTLMGTMLLFGAGLFFVGKAGGAAAGGLMKAGLAVALIGGGIGVAAAGIGYMGEGLASMLNAMNAENTTLFTDFVSTLVLGSAGFAAAGLGLAAMASGISSVASALNEINIDTIKELSKMGGVDVGVTTDGVATNIESIMNAINGVDTLKLGAAAVMVTAAAANNATAGTTTPRVTAQKEKDTNIDVKVYIDGKQMASEAVIAVNNEITKRVTGKGTSVIIPGRKV